MPLNDLIKAGYKLGRGWRFDAKAFAGEGILAQRPAHDCHSIRWYLTRNTTTTTIPSPPARTVVGSIVDYEKRRLIYFREQGIACYNFAEKKEELLIPLDTNLFRAREFWLDNEEDILYFIRQKYSPSWKTLLSRLGKRKATGMKVEHALIGYSFKTGVSRIITDFGGNYREGAVDAKHGVFYAQAGQKILVIDIPSGRIRKEITEPNIVRISCAPGGRTLVWGVHSPVAYQIRPNGTKTASGFQGVSPSFSRDSGRMAFWDRVGAFCVVGKRGKPDRALFLSPQASVDGIAFRPALWCPCNKHLALPLNIPLFDSRSDSALCVLNVIEKTVTLCSHSLNFGFAPDGI